MFVMYIVLSAARCKCMDNLPLLSFTWMSFFFNLAPAAGERLQLRTLARRWHQELEAWSGRRKKRGSRFDLAEIFIIVAKPMRIPYHSIMQASRCETGCGGVLLGRAAEKGFGGLCWRLLRFLGRGLLAVGRANSIMLSHPLGRWKILP